MGNRKKKGIYRRKARLKICFQVTVIGLTILIIGGFASLLTFRSSLNQLTENCKNKIIESVADMISSSHQYISGLMLDIQAVEAIPMDSSEFYQHAETAVQDQSVTPSQQLGDDLLSSMVGEGMLGLEVIYYVLPPGAGIAAEPVVVVSSDDEYMYSEVPDEVAELAESNREYKLFKDGIPGMGLSGEYLVTTYKLESDNPMGALWYFDFKPMSTLIAGVDAFFDEEKRNVYLFLFIVMGLSAFGLFVISFFALGFLINRKITRPVDEMSEAAEKVMDGDLDARVEIRRGEEFSILKHTFNTVISNLSRIISRGTKDNSVEDESGCENENIRQDPKKQVLRSTILFQITALYAFLAIISGVLAVVVVNNSIDKLVHNSERELIETDVDLISSSHDFVLELILMTGVVENSGPIKLSENLERAEAGDLDYLQEPENNPNALQDMIRRMIGYSSFEYTLVYNVVPPIPGVSETSRIVLSTDDEYMYTEPVAEIQEMIDKGEESWKLFKNGIPEMGYNEEYLVTAFPFTIAGIPIEIWSVDFKPMGEKIRSVNNFFHEEKRNLDLVYGITIGISALFTILFVFFALRHLLKKKITEPVDKLTAAAEQVIGGDLDIRVEVNPGEELESLKRAFNEMVRSLRDVIAKGIED